MLNTLRPRQNGRHFADDIFKCIFVNEDVWISIKISLKFVPKGPINNIPALVQIMAWRRAGDKPLSGPMLVSLPTHICVTRSQWVKASLCFVLLWLYKLRTVQNIGTWYPRPRQVSQEPGLRPINLTNRSVFCTDLSLFYSIYFLWVGSWTLHFRMPQCPMPLSTVIRTRLLIRESNLPACLAWARCRSMKTHPAWH